MLSTKEIVLLLLSSVLVSETTQKTSSQDEERNSKEEEKESEKIVEAVMIPEAKGGAPHPQFTKQLDTKWTFWYESKAARDKGRNLNKTDYLKEVKRGKTFDTIASFYDCWNEVQEVCNSSSADCNYELFKHGVKPVWEDPRNIKGGKCVLITPRTTHEETMKHWVSLMITLLIGEFGPDINGVVLSTRSWGNMFAVWVRNSKDKDSVDATMRHLHELFGSDVSIRFQRHQASLRKKFTTNIRPGTEKTQLPLEKESFESEASSFEGSEQREKNKGKEKPRRRSVVTEETKDMLHSLIQEASEAPLHLPIDRVNHGDRREKVATTTPGLSSGISTPPMTSEESSVERIPSSYSAVERIPSSYSSMERIPNSYQSVQKRRPSISSVPNNNKPVARKELPKLSDLSAKEIGYGVAILAAGVATSVLSWTYLY